MASAITCNNPNISLAELLNSILVLNADTGDVGLRTVTQATDFADITPVVNCNMPPLSIEDIIRRAIVLDDDGQPAINLVIGS